MRQLRAALVAALALLVPAQPFAAIAIQAHSRAEDFQLAGRLEQGALLSGIAPEGTVRLTLDGKDVPFAPDRRFIIAFDRDQGGRAVLAADLAGGGQRVRHLAVAARQWDIEHINVARRPGVTSEEYRRRREGELARIGAARAVNSPSGGWRQAFIRPARGRISGRFGSQRIYRGEPASFHTGLDIAPGAGAPVVAPADGKVVLAGPPMFSLEGNLVIIDHGMGLNSAFLHLASYDVREGDEVRQGQRIGTVGATGRATGPHLHWSVTWRGARIDPFSLVRND